MTLDPATREAARRWLAGEVDDRDRAELRALLDRADNGEAAAVTELATRLATPLRFGTAGLRGPVRAGPNGMNRAVVARATSAVARWLTGQGHGGGTVVVGGDARHRSAALAAEAAAVLAGAGFAVRAFTEPVPTPLVAFAVRELDAVAGIQITASHNPASDNGYKLYDATGAQLAPPADTEIEAAMAAAPPATELPRSTSRHAVHSAPIGERYLARVAQLPRGTTRSVRIAFTPLHGTGGKLALAALRRAGFTDVVVVDEQAEPDPDFPTVAFPNPEEPGVCDRLLELASTTAADLAIALDPDADRCAVGIPEPGTGFRMLSGDETGTLLGEYLLATLDRQRSPDPVVASTVVSSSALASIARAHGARYAETLTGFKWLVRAAEQGAAGTLVYAYEEALGHCVDPATVRDKDGIATAVLAADLAAARKAAGSSLRAMLDELHVAHGVHVTEPLTLRLDAGEAASTIMTRLRQRPPSRLAERSVTVTDLLPDADVLRYQGDGLRLAVRPSGTEPKLKAYLEAVEPVAGPGTAEALDQARTTAGHRLAALRQDTRTLVTTATTARTS
ncbi:phospho-sugar mutase [Haloechinothrix sp. LS1_15]|uniref:phospho-sugar mutase n=1 Tax=Haloechinothrix sp. LS1_15 TaxID=2652248 RepID=UPI0029449637|nr:phospho-sugar mutase [Haloechinothrix sp. LS1_15]MDV6012972.1 phospho-sugar mutase [Haloechinothrix sp. LS1_15]